MNKTFLFGAAVFSALTFCSGKISAQIQDGNTPATGSPKILIAYYSYSGNTKEVAEAIHEEIGGDLFEIKTEGTYPENYREMTQQAKKEIQDGYRPRLTTAITDISQFDTIFLGSPNWWGTITPQVSSFLESYNLSGKTVVPFITHGGGGEQNTIRDLTAQCKGCNVRKDGWVGYNDRTFGISGWLEDLGYKK